jgi:hypothetical protein
MRALLEVWKGGLELLEELPIGFLAVQSAHGRQRSGTVRSRAQRDARKSHAHAGLGEH